MPRHLGAERAALAAVLCLAAALRWWGISHDLPYIHHPDEPKHLAIVHHIVTTGDPEPHVYNYPSLFFTVQALAYAPYYLAGRVLGVFRSTADLAPPHTLGMGVSRARMPGTVVLGRVVTLCFGVGSVAMVHLAGRAISGRPAAGLLAALATAVSPVAVSHSRTITPDAVMVFFALVSFHGSVMVWREGRTRDYVLAGIGAGLAASTKYNGALVVLPLLLAHVLRHGRRSAGEPRLYGALLLGAAAFLAATPYALLDFRTFVADVTFEARHYATGHDGMEGDALRWYVRHMWDTGAGLYLLAAAGIVAGTLARPRETWLAAIFPVGYLAFVGGFEVRNDRTFLPAAPFLFLIAAWCAIEAVERLRPAGAGSSRAMRAALLGALAAVLFLPPLSTTVAEARRLAAVDSHETARNWIDAALPPGAVVGIESYSPFVDPSRFDVRSVHRMIDHDPAWYREQGFDYLVFSEGMFGRYLEARGRYAAEARRYGELFREFPVVRVFLDGGYEVRVHQVR